ncbi:MAG: hypothetical protein V4525_08050 [Pseudomonadota bacterium]
MKLPYLPHALQKIGLPGLLGLLLFMVWGTVKYHLIPQQQRELEELRQKMRHPSMPVIVTKPAYTKVQLDWERFPSVEQLSELHKQLHGAANSAGFLLPEVHYQTHPVSSTPLNQLGIDLGFTATYPQFKKWLALLMIAQPTMALETLSLQRTQPQQPQLDIKLKLHWYARRLKQATQVQVLPSTPVSGQAIKNVDRINERLRTDQQSIQRATEAL